MDRFGSLMVVIFILVAAAFLYELFDTWRDNRRTLGGKRAK